jgi:nicotinate-nucleotide pyrophosphorylase (carboxylating)
MNLQQFIREAILEDTQDPSGMLPGGDHSALASIPEDAKKSAKLMVKESGIIAGIDIAKIVFQEIDHQILFQPLIQDGEKVTPGQIAFTVAGSARSLLLAERIVLNIMQRMSGIATITADYVELVSGYKTKILDTRKTTPNFRYFEKLAVKIGGGHNHRFGLYDMIMLKDNHIDYCGGIEKAIEKTVNYLQTNQLNLQIEIETRNLEEVKRVMQTGGVSRIMLDNFTVGQCKEAVALINHQFETEASGGINKATIKDYASTGVDFISVGALTHSSRSLDMSLKAYTNQ